MKKKIAAIAIGVALAICSGAGSAWVLDEYARQETYDLANRQGLNGMLEDAAIDSYRTSRGTGSIGFYLGLASASALWGYYEVRRRNDRRRQTQEQDPVQAYAREFLAQDIEEFRFWKSLQSIKSDRPPVEIGKGIEQ